MRIELPNGTVIDGIPEGTSKEDIKIKAISSGLAQESDFGVVPETAAPPVSNIIPEVEETSFGESILGGLETGVSVLTGAIAEPIAGLAGVVRGLLPGEEGQAAATVEQVREGLTYQPRGETGQRYIQNVGEAIAPVGEVIQSVESGLGDAVFEATGSAALAAGASAIPAAIMEAMGVKGIRAASRTKKGTLPTNTAKAITAAAPDIQTLKNKAGIAYKEMDNYGIKVKADVYDNFVINLEKKLVGKSKDVNKSLYPGAHALVKEMKESMGATKTLTELEEIRKIAGDIAGSLNKGDKRLGTIIIKELDTQLDQLSTVIGGKFKEARAVWHKASKAQQIADMVEGAAEQASGMENGLRIGARQILKSSKKKRGFNPKELDALRKISQGTTLGNISKFLGKFGISENQATSMLGASMGSIGGGSVGMLIGGPAGAGLGAVMVPALGQVAKITAQRITKKNARLADELIRAGSDGEEITKAYLRNTPVKNRKLNDLTDLLANPNVTVASIAKISTKAKLVEDAKFLANALKNKALKAASAEAIALPSQIDREEVQ